MVLVDVVGGLLGAHPLQRRPTPGADGRDGGAPRSSAEDDDVGLTLSRCHTSPSSPTRPAQASPNGALPPHHAGRRRANRNSRGDRGKQVVWLTCHRKHGPPQVAVGVDLLPRRDRHRYRYMGQTPSPGTDDSVGLARHAGVNGRMTQPKTEVGIASVGGQAADHVARIDVLQAHRNPFSPKRFPECSLVGTCRYRPGDGFLTHPTPRPRPTDLGPPPRRRRSPRNRLVQCVVWPLGRSRRC